MKCYRIVPRVLNWVGSCYVVEVRWLCFWLTVDYVLTMKEARDLIAHIEQPVVEVNP